MREHSTPLSCKPGASPDNVPETTTVLTMLGWHYACSTYRCAGGIRARTEGRDEMAKRKQYGNNGGNARAAGALHRGHAGSGHDSAASNRSAMTGYTKPLVTPKAPTKVKGCC